MIIPYDMIDKDSLRNLVEDFVSRDGTDNGYDQSLEDRVDQVTRQLKSGEIVVVFDSASESINIISKEEARRFADSE